MTATYILTENSANPHTITGETDADALRLVYEELCSRNGHDCAKAVAAGQIWDSEAVYPRMLFAHREPEAFWWRLISIMCSDNQDVQTPERWAERQAEMAEELE